ncbi:hypothetical protein F4809DRAFT_628912 [Biscogniauxia mediterranea]|nr:hypothetical protein F4809DRAFT_628912 [Biscogniauxia mediterranea]
MVVVVGAEETAAKTDATTRFCVEDRRSSTCCRPMKSDGARWRRPTSLVIYSAISSRDRMPASCSSSTRPDGHVCRGATTGRASCRRISSRTRRSTCCGVARRTPLFSSPSLAQARRGPRPRGATDLRTAPSRLGIPGSTGEVSLDGSLCCPSPRHLTASFNFEDAFFSFSMSWASAPRLGLPLGRRRRWYWAAARVPAVGKLVEGEEEEEGGWRESLLRRERLLPLNTFSSSSSFCSLSTRS